MNDDVRDAFQRREDERANGNPDWDRVGLENLNTRLRPVPQMPNQHDRLIALSVLKGHCTSDDPAVKAWVSLYEDYKPVGTPLELDMLMGAKSFKEVAEFVCWEVLKWMDECDANDFDRWEINRD